MPITVGSEYDCLWHVALLALTSGIPDNCLEKRRFGGFAIRIQASGISSSNPFGWTIFLIELGEVAAFDFYSNSHVAHKNYSSKTHKNYRFFPRSNLDQSAPSEIGLMNFVLRCVERYAEMPPPLL